MLKPLFKVTFLISFFIIGGSALTPAQQKSLDRKEIDAKYKWNLTDIYKDGAAWNNAYSELEKKMDEIVKLKGTLGKGPNELLKAFKLQDELNILSAKVYSYASLNLDADTRNQQAAADLQKISITMNNYETAISWINPELLRIPLETIRKWMADLPELKQYQFGIEDLFRQQAHVLSEDKEKLISYYGQFSQTPASVYTGLSVADINFPKVKLSDGREIVATAGNYAKEMKMNKNQADRKAMFEAHYNTYKQNENTYAAIYDAVCQKDWATAQARNFSSCIEMNLNASNIPVSVYQNLIATVKQNTAPIQRYIKLRAKALGITDYHIYDNGVPLLEFKKLYPYEEAQKLVLASVAPLGQKYQKNVETALTSGWIDVYENKGKKSGAYSEDVYSVHPYMMLNYNETLNNVFALGHEMGHTMHTQLADENQPYATSQYTIFVAEVASTFNERLLLDYMLSKSTDHKEKAALIMQSIEQIFNTFYFQAQLADFEQQVHKLVEEGNPVTAEVLNTTMKNLYKTYYGDTINMDELCGVSWARIPHIFNVPFYVFQYATCFASSAKLYNEIKGLEGKEKEAAIDKYLSLLKSGGNNYPMEQLKKAGVDLSTTQPYLEVIKELDELVTLLEKEVNNIK